MTSKEAVTDYSPEAVEAILSAFNDRVLQAIHDEERVDDIILHGHLREARGAVNVVLTTRVDDFLWACTKSGHAVYQVRTCCC